MNIFRQLLPALLCASLCTAPVASARDQASSQIPIIDYGERFLPVVARHGMVAGPEKLASEVGTTIMRQGGNAVDAAVATGFALAVTYPRAGNLGGGGFMLIHLAEAGLQTIIDYRETAPAAATRDMFLDDTGELDRKREYFSHQSAGVPGTVAGLLYALDKYGSMSRQQVLAPAIALARDGWAITHAHQMNIGSRADTLRRNPEAKRLFFRPDGSDYAIGDIWRQADLAWTLEQIADKGAAGFYRGEVAARIVAEMERGEGLITARDLADYRAIERQPVRSTFRGYEVVSTPPPSSGGIHILQILNIMEQDDLAAMGHNSAAYLHLLSEAMKRAYADRSEYLGDPDFVEVPVAQLVDKAYAQRLRREIHPTRATPSRDISPGLPAPRESHDTTHYTVADRHGNMVSNTYTLNFSFGSHIAVPGTGMLLNNEMGDFAAVPGQPNAYGLVQGESNRIEGGKRPLSSMTPSLVLKDGQAWLATGSPGGSIIITAVLQTLLNAMAFDMNVATAGISPRVHHQWLPDSLSMEHGISPDTVRLLEGMGHQLQQSKRTLGRTQSIMLEDGWLYGATDTRRPGGWVAAY